MEEIRFNRPEQPKVVESSSAKDIDSRGYNKISVGSNVIKFALVILIVLVLSVLIYLNRDFFEKKDLNTSDYYAVFLSNGQVYFGKSKDKNKQEFVITDVYYLQIGGGATAQQELSESQFSLVKLGNELHGPTDEMFINMHNVIFYEKLKRDSKVVESIMKTKK